MTITTFNKMCDSIKWIFQFINCDLSQANSKMVIDFILLCFGCVAESCVLLGYFYDICDRWQTFAALDNKAFQQSSR